MPNLMRQMGQPVEIRTRDGRVHRGIMAGVDPRRGVFIRDGFGRRRFFAFIFIVAFFSRRRRIF
ncbi:hypothetical protein R4Z09_13665 [Niallia oryzisoli]|uniref:Uncharacterized protein n=1 Tax=Niallia oryzisoli TaxID=1737571 RepID=A0ABZ2CKM0_9BACI